MSAEKLNYYDAHNHLQDTRLSSERTEIVRDLKRKRIQAVVCGTREEDWDEVLRIAREDPESFIPSLGLHPWYVKQRSDDWLERLKEAVNSRSCAVGEIGLDRWIEGHNAQEQEEVFVAQLRFAAERGLPVTIHCLRTWGALHDLLVREKRPRSGFLLHSYGGPAEMIGSFVELGGYFSISGYFAQDKKARQREVFRKVPLERLLIETDAPDMMPPARFRADTLKNAELNHPVNIVRVYEFASDLLGVKLPQLRAQVKTNFRRLFGPVLS